MLKRFNILSHLTAAALLIGLASCSAIYDDAPEAPDAGKPGDDGKGLVHVAFRLAMNDKGEGPVIGARADASDVGNGPNWIPDTYRPDDEGDAYDNTIDPTSLRVMLLNSSKQLAGVITDLKFKEIYTGSAAKEYEFTGTVTGEQSTLIPGQDYHIIISANAPDFVADQNSYLPSLTYNWSYNWSNPDGSAHSERNYIPMFGIIKQKLNLVPSEIPQNLGTIYLLRSLAKVDVALDGEAADGYDIVKVSLDKAFSKGRVFPGGFDPYNDQLPSSTTALVIDKSLNVPNDNSWNINFLSSGTEHPSGSEFQISDDKKLARLYTPEYGNPYNVLENSISITVKDKETGMEYVFTGNRDKQKGIFFKKYSSNPNDYPITDGYQGKPYNIIRNHYYKFNITQVKVGLLRFKVTIKDMEKGGDWEYEI